MIHNQTFRSNSIEKYDLISILNNWIAFISAHLTVCFPLYRRSRKTIIVITVAFFVITIKPVYLEYVDNWFLKLVLYYFNKYIFKNQLSTR
jgi:hypothetical protein